jgi:nucleotide-binding universal stress UspA family protein
MMAVTANCIDHLYFDPKLNKMKTILVPTDFSEYALQAIRTAVPIAIATGAKIVLLHNVYTETKWETVPILKRHEYPETLKKILEADKRINSLMNSNLFRKVSVSNILTYGVAYEEIVLKAKQLKVDLILMGSHGNEASDRNFIGSTVQKVLREATCPVMTIQKKYTPGKWRKLVFATDFSKETYKYFEKIKNLALALNSVVYLMFVNRPTDFLDTRTVNRLMDSFIARYPDLKFQKVIYNHEDTSEGILQFVEDYPSMDWIALITQRRNAKPKYVIGNTETLAFHSNIPVLSVNILPVPLK